MSVKDVSKAIENLEKRSQSLNNKLKKHKVARKYFSKSFLLASNLRQRSNQLLASAGLLGTILTSPITTIDQKNYAQQQSDNSQGKISQRLSLKNFLQEKLPYTPSKLGQDEVLPVEEEITQATGINVKGYLDGQSLNHHLGYIGYEQHLTRYPGDNLGLHDEDRQAGMAPGRGAFGYFAQDVSKFTTKDYLREKYYCVVQTLYLSDWDQNHQYLKDWYKFRKMMVINPVNGNAVICDIGDAGPAQWTGKQFGGSPEVMKLLNLHDGPRKGLVLMFFVDDPNDDVPLGPINY